MAAAKLGVTYRSAKFAWPARNRIFLMSIGMIGAAGTAAAVVNLPDTAFLCERTGVGAGGAVSMTCAPLFPAGAITVAPGAARIRVTLMVRSGSTMTLA